MGSMLMDSEELAREFAADVRTAKAWCIAHGIEPIDLGTGAKKCLRWYRPEVESALCTRRDHSSVPSSSSAKPAQTAKVHAVESVSVSQNC